MSKYAAVAFALFSSCFSSAETDYRKIVVTFADTLLEHGRDRYGSRPSPVWMAVINAKDYSVPTDPKQVPAPPGVRGSDRALGGANLSHDLVTIRVLDALSRITGQQKYRRAVDDYLRYYLKNAQSPETGLIAWGEHLYYNAFADRVATERKWHELLHWTPPWIRLWGLDRRATERAIAGIWEWHYFDRDKAMFNRHADYLGRTRPDPLKAQPWIKHSALHTYSFALAYAKTRDRRYLDWARSVGALYWNARNPKTNLVEGCIGDPRPTSRLTGPGGMLPYWLFKAYELVPSESEWRDRAIALMVASDRYSYDEASGGYLSWINTDGTRTTLRGGSHPARVWDFAYGGEGVVLRFGRAAAYLAAKTKHPQMLVIARRVEKYAYGSPRPADRDIGTLGDALNLSMDLFDLTGEQVYLDHASEYAQEVVRKFWCGGLFRSHTGYDYYEAALGVGDAVQGLLRVSLVNDKSGKKRGGFDWSY